MTAQAATWIDLQLLLLDLLSDSWRWWAAMGGLLGLRPVILWLVDFAKKCGDIDHFPPRTRFILAIALLFGLFANIAAGAVIPLATDGRLSWLEPGSPPVLVALALAWLCWGCLGWAVAIAFAASKRRMAAASVCLWFACYVGSGVTMGAQL